jgi:TonB family protein
MKIPPLFGLSSKVICGALLLTSSFPSLCFGQAQVASGKSDSVPVLPQSALDSLKLARAGIGEDIILRQLRHAAPVDLTADQIIYLTNAGVSQSIVKALVDGGTPPRPDSDKVARPNQTVIAVGVSPHTDSPAPTPELNATTVSPSSDPYEELGPTMSGTWTADLDPGYDGAPRQITITHRRNADTGGIAIESRILTKGKSTPEASGLIQWDPQELTFHFKTVRASGEVIAGIFHPEANVLISEGTTTFNDGAKLDSKSVASVSSQNAGAVEVFLKYKGEWVFSSGLKIVRIGLADKSWPNGEPSNGPHEDSFESARVVKTYPPKYPFLEKLSFRPKNDTVYVEFVINADGTISDANSISETNPAFENAAVIAVKKWMFSPAKKNGIPMRSVRVIPIVFKLTTPSDGK